MTRLVSPLARRRTLGRFPARLAPLLCCLTLAGCGRSGPATVPVSGSVSFGGQPVAEGEIQFRSADGGSASWAGPITAGRYELRSTVGPKRVEIIAVRPKPGAKPKPSGEGVVNEMYIPDRYNLESELTAEVTDAGANQFDFSLE